MMRPHSPRLAGEIKRDNPEFLQIEKLRIVPFSPTTLTQRTFGPTCSATTWGDVSHLKPGDTAGLIALMETYGYVGVKATDTGRAIVMTRADKPAPVEVASVPLTQNTVYFKIDCDFADRHDNDAVGDRPVSFDARRKSS